MLYILNIEQLEPGDIILAGYNDKNSREIQRRTNSKYSHAMLYWNGSILHAADIVISENPSRMLFKEDESVCILRLKDELWNELRIKCLINYARTFVGTYYDIEALIAMKRGNVVTPNDNRQMCSKFVAQCYDYVCLDLVEDCELCTPEDINKSKIMNHVDNPLLEATEDDIKFANSYDVTKVQHKAIKDFLVSLNELFPEEDIVSLMQVEKFIEKEPTNGDVVLELLKKTDYFDLWRLEKEHCQYLYNSDEFKSMWKDWRGAVKQAIAIIQESKLIIGDKEGDILAYEQKIATVGDIDYYRQMIEVRKRVIERAKERIEVAEQVLKDYRIVKISYPWLNCEE